MESYIRRCVNTVHKSPFIFVVLYRATWTLCRLARQKKKKKKNLEEHEGQKTPFDFWMWDSAGEVWVVKRLSSQTCFTCSAGSGSYHLSGTAVIWVLHQIHWTDEERWLSGQMLTNSDGLISPLASGHEIAMWFVAHVMISLQYWAEMPSCSWET